MTFLSDYAQFGICRTQTKQNLVSYVLTVKNTKKSFFKGSIESSAFSVPLQVKGQLAEYVNDVVIRCGGLLIKLMHVILETDGGNQQPLCCSTTGQQEHTLTHTAVQQIWGRP